MKANKVLIRWVLLVIVAIVFAINYSSIFDSKIDSNGDNLFYYYLGKSLSEGNGYILGYELEYTPHMHFPPGYPAFISLILKIFPDSTKAVKIANGLLLLLSISLLFRIIRKTVPKYGLVIAFLTSLLCSLHPILLRWSTIMMSEMLYLAVSMGIISICLDLDLDALMRKEKQQIFLLILLCVLIFCTYLIRALGISIIISASLSFAIIAFKKLTSDKTMRKCWICPLAVSLCIIVSFFASKAMWDIRNQKVSPGYKSDYVQTFLSKGAGNGSMQTFDDWKSRVTINLKSFATFYIPQSIFHPRKADTTFYDDIKNSTASTLIGILSVAIMVLGIMYLSGARWLLLIYLLATFGILFLYQEQYAGLRYMVPVIPLLIFAFLAGIVSIIDIISVNLFKCDTPVIGTIALVLVSIMIGKIFIEDQTPYKQYASIKTELEITDDNPYRQFISACAIFERAPKDFVVACRKPEFFYFFSGYHKSIKFPMSASEEEVLDFLIQNNVKAIIIDSWFPQASRVLVPTVDKYPEYFTLFAHCIRDNATTYVMRFDPNPGN